jgi:hypothetical protein
MVKETFQFLIEKINLICFKKIQRTTINKTGRRKIVLKFVTYKEYPPIISKKLTIALEKSLSKSIILICKRTNEMTKKEKRTTNSGNIIINTKNLKKHLLIMLYYLSV